MPIEFRCPNCDTPYRLKDELAGKTARCKNAECRKVMTIPQPPAEVRASGRDTPAPAPAVDADAVAMSALTDDGAQKVVESANDDRTIAMTCEVCEHPWTVPISMAGKNALCPECQRRQRVPEPKPTAKDDWRHQRTNLPSLAKRDEEKLEGVQSSETRNVSTDSLVESGAIEEDLDPLPVSHRAVMYGVPTLVVLGILFAIGNWYFSRTEVAQVNLIHKAQEEFAAASAEEKPAAPHVPLFSACLELAAGEHAVRQPPTSDSLKDAHNHFTKALADLRLDKLSPADAKKADYAARNALLGEIALAMLDLGGTPEQVAAQVRYRWVPDTTQSKIIRVNDRIYTVHEELQRTLQVLQNADFDLKIPIARRLTRELVRRGHTEMAPDIAVQLFKTDEQPEAKAIIGLEIKRADKSSDKAKELAEQLKDSLKPPPFVKGKKPATPPSYKPYPASAQALWQVCNITETPLNKMALPSAGPVQEPYLRANLTELLLQDGASTADAVALAMRGSTVEAKLRSLALIAEWASDPALAIEAATALIDPKSGQNAKKEKLPNFVVYRLAQLAAQAGKADDAKKMAGTISDDGLRDWAKAEIVRQHLSPKSKEPADVALMEVPDDHAKLRLGHAWGRMAIARHAGRLSGDRNGWKQFSSWPPGSIHPFALAGYALGLQDYDQSP